MEFPTEKPIFISKTPNYEPDILIYDRSSQLRLMVTLQELKTNTSYSDFYVYGTLGQNLKVADYLKERAAEEENKQLLLE